jgi:hypothetical protein
VEWAQRAGDEAMRAFSYANGSSHRIFEIWRVKKVADRP